MTKVDMTLQTTLTEGTATVVDTRTTPIEDTGIVKQDTGVFTIPASSTDVLVSLGACDSARYLHVEIGAACTIKLNSTLNTGIVFAPITGQVALLALAGCAVTALYVTNPVGVAMMIRVVAAE